MQKSIILRTDGGLYMQCPKCYHIETRTCPCGYSVQSPYRQWCCSCKRFSVLEKWRRERLADNIEILSNV